MKFQSRSQIEALTKFNSQGDLVTSFFLDTDKGRLNRKEIQLALKNLLSGAKAQVEALDASRERIESLERDLALIGDHGAKMLAGGSGDGLAVFSCSRRNFWQALELPHGPRNRVIIDSTFYVRPLDAILDKYSPICVLLLSRREARWYHVSMSEIEALDEIKSDVPPRVREGGFEGNESKKIERHLDSRLQDHFKKTAQKTVDLGKKHPFEWLFINYEDNHGADFEGHLHSYLREKIKARLHAHVSDPPAKVLQEVLDIEVRLKKAGEEETVQKLVGEL